MIVFYGEGFDREFAAIWHDPEQFEPFMFQPNECLWMVPGTFNPEGE